MAAPSGDTIGELDMPPANFPPETQSGRLGQRFDRCSEGFFSKLARSARRGDGRRVISTKIHVEPHLAIGDMSAGQRIGPRKGKNRSLAWLPLYRQTPPFGRTPPPLA